jgi:hypothetical protein
MMKADRAVSFAKVSARAQYRRAVEAGIWGMPLVSFAAMRQAYFRDAGAQYNDVVYWSKPADWRYQVVASNSTSLRAVFFTNLIGGPVVIRVPRAEHGVVSGVLVDSWNVPLASMGCDGLDHGDGADYTLLPPHHGKAHAGKFSVRSTTYNVCSSIRVIPKSRKPKDVAKSVAYLKQLQVHHTAGGRTLPRLIDMPGVLFDGMVRFDASFYDLLAQMVREEPINGHDLAFMGQLHALGIGKEVAFSADPSTARLLGAAIMEVRAHVIQGFRAAGSQWWPNRRWKSILDGDVLDTNLSCVREDRVLIDERAQLAFAAFGLGWDVVQSLALKAFEDSQGRNLSGTHAYRLRVPPTVPTGEFWSVTVYDSETAAFIRKAPVVGIDSFTEGLVKNSDGSVDIYLSPLPLPESEANWIATAVNRTFFVLYRNHGLRRELVQPMPSWVLGDIERLDSGEFFRRT